MQLDKHAVDQIVSEIGTDSVAIVSGGLDSTTLVYDMLDKGYRPHLLSFNYGQRHMKELRFASRTAEKLKLPFDIIDLTGLTHLISNSALTDTSPKLVPSGNPYDKADRIEVPEGHYAEDTMKLTVVPNRNMIMLSIATGVAVNEKARCVGIGVHAGDHFVYPDCRPAFIQYMNQAISTGNEGFDSFEWGVRDEDENLKGALYAPFLRWSKADIAYRALELDVPLHETWSCYKGGDKHCGKCGTCVERLEAINEAFTRWNDGDRPVSTDVKVDLTEYEDSEFWKRVTDDRS